MGNFWLCFVPLFVAVDPLGILPIFIGFTADMEKAEVRRVIFYTMVTATAVALVFLYAGTAVLRVLGITVADFMVAGGVVLLVLSVSDLASPHKERRFVDPQSLGAVPLGVPLVTGPAVLTTSILLLREYGWVLTTSALVANMALAAAVFALARPIIRLIGRTGARIISKIAALLLAAIAVMLIRRGIVQWGL
ncbi:MAG: MarC family protein [Deltaproteobacteria bacterium]|nr:MarC family protein [Deltaproteobacteria bacterium]